MIPSPPKSDEEIEGIRQSCRLTDRIFSLLIENCSFSSELSVSGFIADRIRALGGKPAFRTIVASEGNAATPHHKPTLSPLKGFVVIDFGVNYRGYCSDMTRTLFFGRPRTREQKLYNLVLTAQETVIRTITPHMPCQNAYLTASTVLGHYKHYFIHRLGHGIGKKVHEAPYLGRKSRYIFAPNCVFTVEPGIYLPGELGIRIEDTVLLKDRVETLTLSAKNLISI
ncbi:MAG: M24 family metallopeptidase [archaeon]